MKQIMLSCSGVNFYLTVEQLCSVELPDGVTIIGIETDDPDGVSITAFKLLIEYKDELDLIRKCSATSGSIYALNAIEYDEPEGFLEIDSINPVQNFNPPSEPNIVYIN